jgi:hypothetical protein
VDCVVEAWLTELMGRAVELMATEVNGENVPNSRMV